VQFTFKGTPLLAKAHPFARHTNPETKPNNPTHHVRHICKAHKADTQKLTLQKSLPCSHASWNTPNYGGHIRSFGTRKNGERTGVWQNTSGRNPCFIFWFIMHLHIQPELKNLAAEYIINFLSLLNIS